MWTERGGGYFTGLGLWSRCVCQYRRHVTAYSTGQVFSQQFHEAQDMAQRRAQIVRDGITERLQLLVGGLQLRRAFDDALLQFRIEPADFILRVFALGDVADIALD